MIRTSRNNAELETSHETHDWGLNFKQSEPPGFGSANNQLNTAVRRDSLGRSARIRILNEQAKP